MKNRSFWIGSGEDCGKPLSTKGNGTNTGLIKEPSSARLVAELPSRMDWTGLGMHLLRQFERESLKVGRKGRKEKVKALRGENKCSKVCVKISSKKTLERFTSLPLAGPRRRAHLKRVQLKSISRRKHCPVKRGRKAARLMWKRPVRARRLSLGKYLSRKNSRGLTNTLRFIDESYLIKTRIQGTFEYAMVPWSSSWGDRTFWLSELFPKLYRHKLARFGKSRKERRAGFSRRIRKSRHAQKKTDRANRRQISKSLQDRASRPAFSCRRCGFLYCRGVESLEKCCMLTTWRKADRPDKYGSVELASGNVEENVALGSPSREVIVAEEPRSEPKLMKPVRKSKLICVDKGTESLWHYRWRWMKKFQKRPEPDG